MRRVSTLFFLVFLASCATLPTVKHDWHSFPEKDAFFDPPEGREYETLGWVRAKIEFPTLDAEQEEQRLCENYFNKAVKQLVKYAREKGGHAVLDVKSVVFYVDGRTDAFPRAECSDDGAEGQVLVRGIAVRWKPAKAEAVGVPVLKSKP